MANTFTTAELEGYLDEALPIDGMVRIETALRGDPQLVRQLAAIHARRDAGVHSLGEIWRRHRLSCPTREQLGSYLLGVLEPAHADYVKFHLDAAGCRTCQASLEDLRREQQGEAAAAQTRRRKYFQSSAGHLRKRK